MWVRIRRWRSRWGERLEVVGTGVVGVGGGIGVVVVVVASFALILAFVVVGRIRGRVGSGSVR